MTRYLISFNDGDMDFPEEDFPAVREEARAVMVEGIDAGIWIVRGGFQDFSPRVVDADGSVTEGPLAESPVRLGGFTVIDVSTDDEALKWAAKIAVACRCAQEIRKIIADPLQESLQGS